MSEAPYDGIAIVGMAGRFPGADNVDQFWSNLLDGKETISFFSNAELAESGLDRAALDARGHYVPARGMLRDADTFDAPFFGIHPKEATVMDPQQRVFLEACWTALEQAGYAPSHIESAVGVFAGATFNTYYMHVLHRRPELTDLVGPEMVMFGNEKDFLTTRVAYKLGLRGPALNVSTACSTSLVAVCQACQSLLTYQCDMALAGGISVTVPQKRGYYHDEGNIGSADGHTRTFDARATGTVFSNGVGVVVLKRLEDAVRDGDRVYAVIKGAALNNDGSDRVSFGAPGIEGQADVIAMAHALAGFEPDTISYVEAHGTATSLGDPIEVAALTKAFRLGTDRRQYCALGSVKTNVGHLDVAAGVTGLIKTALALHHGVIPATLHFERPNPKLDLERSPFYVNPALQPWVATPGVPRRAGVSSFGTGGTNAHVVMEEAPPLARSGPSRPWQLLTISAKTSQALEHATDNLVAHLRHVAEGPDALDHAPHLADAAFTLHTGRSALPHRRTLACRDAADAALALELRDVTRVFTHHQQLVGAPVVFMFPGQGAQYPGMGAELYRAEPVFRDEVDRCAEWLAPVLDRDLRDVMFARDVSGSEAQQTLLQTRFTQPALFVTEYALAKLWMSWGVKPAGMIGHSVGEYVAGCLAGVFMLVDALSLVARRGALVQAQPTGAMLAVRTSEGEVSPLLGTELAIAAVNSPTLCVVSGPDHCVEVLERELETRDIAARRLHTSHAFHSPMMEPVLAPFRELLDKVTLGRPQIPYVSNVTARWITAEDATSPAYWAGHVRDTVRFSDGIVELMKDPRTILLEVGPGHTLSTLARQHPAKSPEQAVLASLPVAGAEELRGLLETAGRLSMIGAEVDWPAFYAPQSRRRVSLPTYPFERIRYWPDSPAITRDVSPSTSSSPRDGRPVEAAQPASVPALDPFSTSSSHTREERLLTASRSLLQELSGYDLSSTDPSASLLELGLDSLLLTQAAQLLQRKFGVSVTFRQLMEELGSLRDIAAYLHANLPADAVEPVRGPASAEPGQSTPPPAGTLTSAGHASAEILRQILQSQLQLTNQVLQFLGQPQSGGADAALAPVPLPPPPMTSQPVTQAVKSHGPFRPVDRSAVAMSAIQRRAVDDLIARYTRRTAASKRVVAEDRPFLADPRSAAGFKPLWKEMVYPIVTTRSNGAAMWDVDGNEYVDFVMGFGANMFGHRPPFVVKAVQEQLEHGFEIGPIQPLAGEVAALVREFTRMERVAFTNTGSEAVLAAARLARTVTGRDTIALFAGAYHGIFDEVLCRPVTVNGEMRAMPIAPGIPQSAVSQVLVLEYGSAQSMDILRARGSELAAVLVEPVQSRRLDLQPREFLHDLRRSTEHTGTALIFDEVVTGFRVEPGGAQAYFDVRADLATYGKVLGGGLPIGVVAGARRFMDALDGGEWQYGDASSPNVGVTFFAGTFVRHPLALAAAKSVLTHLRESGPELQQQLTARTAQVAAALQAIIEEFEAPYHVAQFSSLIQITFPPEQKFGGLLFYLLRERGIHTWENRAFVITTAHTTADFSRLTTALRESLAEMRAAEFLSTTSGRKIQVAAAAVTASSEIADTPTLGAAAAAHAAADNGTPFPLTESQQEIWLAAQMGEDAAVAYNESLKLDFRGAFDAELFRTAARQVIERHPILLASVGAGGQSQQVRVDTTLDIPLVDVQDETDAERERVLSATIGRHISEPFNLTSGPLLRVSVVRLSPEHHVVVWTAHHIVCDGWSHGVVVSELATIYTALAKAAAPKLEPPASFREYALQAMAGASETAEALAYWQRQFAVVPEPLALPADRPKPSVRSTKAATVRKALGPSLHERLKRVAGRERATMVVLMSSALQTLLYRLSGQTDLVIGMPVAGQAVSGQTCLVGHCVNLLPVRTSLEPHASFRETLNAVKKSVLDAFDHHQCTLGRILQHVAVPRDASRPPLVQVAFNIDRDVGEVKFPGLTFACARNPKRASHFDLFFNVVEGAHAFSVECDYNTDLFEQTTIERWLQHYQTLLEGIADDPAATIARLPVLTEAERTELTIAWNTPLVEFPKEVTVHEWFERQVAKTPDASALTFEGGQWTYDELNRRANQLARYLKRVGVGPDVLVGLFIDRSPEMVLGILGILKAGGAYLPIDPIYPQNRIALMLEDADVPVLLTQSRFARQLTHRRSTLVCFDADQAGIEREAEDNPEHTSTPDHLAYVLYTSGSTGRPKGSLITHHHVVRLMRASERWHESKPDDVWTLFHSHAFDFSVWELWGALLYGGRLVLVAEKVSRSPEDFYRLLVEDRVTVLNQTPSAFKQLMEAEARLGASQQLALRRVILGGEALDMQSLAPWFERHGDDRPQLINGYGITETTVFVTFRPLKVTDLQSGSVIGRPMPDLSVYVLDPYQQPVPIGVTGELYVGGAGVGRGYLNRPELTAERFLPDRFTNKAKAWLYRSGDLVRYLPGRDIEYVGRIDDQVKIRGFRIELGEIETALRGHPAVRDAAVLMREDVPGDRRLVAYVQGAGLSASDLRVYLKRGLPDYAVPAAFVNVERWPLTAHGKLDKRALPAPVDTFLDPHSRYLEPSTPTERRLAAIWKDVLRLDRIGAHDDFFGLGGHSLLAVQLVGRVHQEFGVTLPPTALFEHAVLVDLARQIDTAARPQPAKSQPPSIQKVLVEMATGGAGTPFFWVHGVGGEVFSYMELSRHLAAARPVYGFAADWTRMNDGRAPTLEAMATHYIREMRAAYPSGPYHLGGFCGGAMLALEMARQLELEGQHVGMFAVLDYELSAVLSGSSRLGATRAFLENLPRWVRDDAMVSGMGEVVGRLRSGIRRTAGRLRRSAPTADSRAKELDLRDRIGMWRFPDHQLSMLEAHYTAFHSYRPTPFGGTVTLFIPRTAPLFGPWPSGGDREWERLALGGVEVHLVPGSHSTMLTERFAEQLAQELNEAIARAERQPPRAVSPSGRAAGDTTGGSTFPAPALLP